MPTILSLNSWIGFALMSLLSTRYILQLKNGEAIYIINYNQSQKKKKNINNYYIWVMF